MKDSMFWRVVGIGAVLGLLWIGYGLSKNSTIPPTSFSTAAYADDVVPGKPLLKAPNLIFDSFADVPSHDSLRFERAKVPGGWFVLVNQRGDGVGGFTFYPDPRHKWTGGSLMEIAEKDTTAKETVKPPSVPPSRREPKRILPPGIKPAEAAKKAMELYDTNKDGKISGPELDKAPGLKAALKVMKTDAEKGVTAEQIAERIQKWLDSRIGRMSLSCQVLHNGQPLSGATVKFVPEKFLSDYLKETASGKTNENGMAMISLPTEPGPDALPPGLTTGMFRVEITKDGENIPAMYNTATVLGQEVSLDNIDMQMGIKFNLKY